MLLSALHVQVHVYLVEVSTRVDTEAFIELLSVVCYSSKKPTPFAHAYRLTSTDTADATGRENTPHPY